MLIIKVLVIFQILCHKNHICRSWNFHEQIFYAFLTYALVQLFCHKSHFCLISLTMSLWVTKSLFWPKHLSKEWHFWALIFSWDILHVSKLLIWPKHLLHIWHLLPLTSSWNILRCFTKFPFRLKIVSQALHLMKIDLFMNC